MKLRRLGLAWGSVGVAVVALQACSSDGASGSDPGDGGSSATGSDSGGVSADGGSDSGNSGEGGDGTGGMSGLHVSGGHIVNGSGAIVKLHGADQTGSQTNCAYQAGGATGQGFFDMPNTQAGIDQMLAWKINAVRVPLNEDCWLGINGLPFGGSTSAAYQAAIQSFVNLLTTNGIAVIVDLHWAGPGTVPTNPALGQIDMADADHAATFWTQVATTFKGNSSVIFDLYNEPNVKDWGCWLKGAPASAACAKANGQPYAVAGMATMLKAVRSTGATNIAILGGLSYAQDFSMWLASVQSIPSLPAPLDGIAIDNVAASWHAYDDNAAYTKCPSQYNVPPYSVQSCATAQQFAAASGITGVLSAGFPVVVGELGISAFSTPTASKFSAAQLTVLQTWLDDFMTYIESQGQGYLGWAWDLQQSPVLITNFATGAPTPYFGVTFQKHLTTKF